MMARPTCIVCGKPIAKRTVDYWFRLPRAGFHMSGVDYPEIPAGTRETNHGGSIVTLYVEVLPQSKEQAQRYVNGEIISVKRTTDGIHAAGVWDGESYRDKYFHADACAARQGYAAAQHGHRYVWKDK